jgi:hypothetical protein
VALRVRVPVAQGEGVAAALPGVRVGERALVGDRERLGDTVAEELRERVTEAEGLGEDV